jgi:hypothetical protein
MTIFKNQFLKFEMDLIMKKLFFTRRYPVQAYFLVVFIISWGLILLLAGPGNIPLDPEQSKSLLLWEGRFQEF